jgi:hypothetical protein
LPLRTYSVNLHAQPALQRATAHLEGTNVCSAGEPISLSRLDAHHESALSARAHGHVAVDEEGQTPEHALLRQSLLVREKTPQTIREVIVESHTRSVGRAQSELPSTVFRSA